MYYMLVYINVTLFLMVKSLLSLYVDKKIENHYKIN